MKMPSRPFYPVALPPDIFGLQHPSLLGQAFESQAETRSRIATVEKGVEAAFKAAVGHLGEEEARQLFARVLRRPKRGPGKMLAPDRDTRLLNEYDEAAQTGDSVAALARRLRAATGTELGNTEGAIATQIWKLVRERKKRLRAASFEARRWRMATRGEQPGLLSVAASKK
jgi:hypothetical protein